MYVYKYIDINTTNMRVLFLCLILGCVRGIAALDIDTCPQERIDDINFYVCPVENYKKVYFHDITGENLITIVPDRLYRNRNIFVAYSADKRLYVATERYSESQWNNSVESIRNNLYF